LEALVTDTAPFNDDNLKAFAVAWYLALDNHAPTEELAALLTDDVQMVFPEKTLTGGISDFKAWYAGGKYADGDAAPGVINIFFDENHNVVSVAAPAGANRSGDQLDVRVVVAWQASWFVAPATKAKRTSLDATQEWTLKRSSKNRFGIVIARYNAMAEPFAYAPGFARL
jgi:hypothetical protein